MTGYSLTKKPTEGIDGPDDETSDANSYEVSYRAGAGLSIAALAIAGTYDVSGDFTNADYLKAAEEAFAYLEKHNIELTNDGKENIVDDYCALMAATELYKATENETYLKAADKRASSLSNRLIKNDSGHYYWRADDVDRPFFHAADAGLPVVSLLKYAEVANEEQTVNSLFQSAQLDQSSKPGLHELAFGIYRAGSYQKLRSRTHQLFFGL